VLVVAGLVYLGYFLVRLVADVNGFATRENVEDLLVPPLLTLAFVPFLIGAAWLSRREQENFRRRFEVRSSHT
jgi:hypothetical protein